MKITEILKSSITALLLLLCCQYAGAEDNNVPPMEMPQRWAYTPDIRMEIPSGTDSWWSQIGDSTLDSLISLGVERNYNLSIAMRRMTIARAAVGQARSAWMPSVGLNAGWTRTRTSGDVSPTGAPMTSSYFNAGLSAQWEIDIFGKIATGVKAKKAAFSASQAEYAGAMIALASQIASTYIDLCKYQSLMTVAQEHAKAQKKIVDISQARYEATLASKLDVAQASEAYYSTLATIPTLQTSINTTINALAVLIGEYPENVKSWLSINHTLPQANRIFGTDAPAELLRRRPDIAQAEAELAEAAAGLGMAKKDFLPSLTINGRIGSSAHNIGDMMKKNSFSYSVEPTLSWTLFDGLNRRYAVQAAREQMESALDSYRLTVLNAVEEVDNAITAFNQATLYAQAIDKVIEQNNESVRLSLQRYKSALAPMTDVVNAQINALTAESQRITAQADALSALVSLYEAMGGGFEADSIR